MPTIKRFEDLEAWRIARKLTEEVYRVSRNEKFIRDYGLRDQICRAEVSVMSNIAEGFERGGNREFVNFLSMAKGSAGEVRAQLYVALDQNYIAESEFASLYEKADRNGKLIAGLIKYLTQAEIKGTKYK